jgi:hypothetical protein
VSTHQRPNCRAGLLRNFELYRATRLFLHDNGARLHFAARCYIVYFDPNQVAAAQLAIDREVKQRQVPDKLSQLRLFLD